MLVTVGDKRLNLLHVTSLNTNERTAQLVTGGKAVFTEAEYKALAAKWDEMGVVIKVTDGKSDPADTGVINKTEERSFGSDLLA